MPGGLRPSTRFCGSCGNILVATSKSAMLFLAYIIATQYLVFDLCTKIGIRNTEALPLVVLFIVFLVSVVVIWPLILEVKIYRYRSRKNVWLPKSIAVGYIVYLLLPIILISLLVYLSVTHET